MNCIKVNYWRMDLSRTFGSWRWVLSVFGVVFAFALCGGSGMQYSAGSVLDIVDSIFWGRLLMLTIPFCTFAFGDGLCADCEKKFYRLLYIRGDRKKYLRAKITVGFLSACAAMTVGFFLYCLALSFRFPMMIDGRDYSGFYMESYGQLLQNGCYFPYLLLVGLQFGLLAGILTTAGMAFSAFVSNRLLVFATPLFLYYFLINVFAEIGDERPYLQMHLLFKALYIKPWDSDLLSFGWVVLITLVFVLLFGKIAGWGMDRRCANG